MARQIDLNKLAGELDGLLSPDGKTGFFLLTFPLDQAGTCEFVTNAPRDSVISMLTQQLKHLRVQRAQGLAPVPINGRLA